MLNTFKCAVFAIACGCNSLPCFSAEPIWEQRGRDTKREALTADNKPLVSYAPLVKKVSPAIVNIASRREAGKVKSLGSGFIINKQGYVVTSESIVTGITQLEVTLPDGRVFSSEVIGANRQSGIAVLKMAATGDLPTLWFGDATSLAIGDFVIAFGNPFGARATANAGIVSDIGTLDRSTEPDFIQTDAYIGPGNAGGPLCNLDGEVVGVNAVLINGERIYFAIPINVVKANLLEMLSNKTK